MQTPATALSSPILLLTLSGDTAETHDHAIGSNGLCRSERRVCIGSAPFARLNMAGRQAGKHLASLFEMWCSIAELLINWLCLTSAVGASEQVFLGPFETVIERAS